MPAHQHRSIRQVARLQKAQHAGSLPEMAFSPTGHWMPSITASAIPICLSRDRNRAHLVAEPIKPIL